MGSDVTTREAVEVVTDAERRARVLEAAALEIEVRGWTTGSEGTLEDATAPRCILGGIWNALGSPRGADQYGLGQTVWGDRGVSFQMLYVFNDTLLRKVEEVTFLLRWRAEEIRDGR